MCETSSVEPRFSHDGVFDTFWVQIFTLFAYIGLAFVQLEIVCINRMTAAYVLEWHTQLYSVSVKLRIHPKHFHRF